MWLRISSYDTLIVDARRYIASQPVEYEQIQNVIDDIRLTGSPVRARVDVSDIRLRDVNIMGVVRIIWELHEHTRDEPLLESITFSGAPPSALSLWHTVQSILPDFVVDLVKFDSFRDEHTSNDDEHKRDQDECHQA